MSDLVSGVLTRISEIEALAEAAARDTGEPHWKFSDLSDGVYTAEYGATFAVGPWGGGLPKVGPHLVAHDPHAVLRLCRAHRQIVELHKITVTSSRNFDPMSDGYVTDYEVDCEICGSVSSDPEDVCETLRALAVGLGVVEEDRNGE